MQGKRLHHLYSELVPNMQMTGHRQYRLPNRLQSVPVDQRLPQLVSYRMRQQLLR